MKFTEFTYLEKNQLYSIIIVRKDFAIHYINRLCHLAKNCSHLSLMPEEKSIQVRDSSSCTTLLGALLYLSNSNMQLQIMMPLNSLLRLPMLSKSEMSRSKVSVTSFGNLFLTSVL